MFGEGAARVDVRKRERGRIVCLGVVRRGW